MDEDRSVEAAGCVLLLAALAVGFVAGVAFTLLTRLLA